MGVAPRRPAPAGKGKGKGGKKADPHAGEIWNPGEENPTVAPFMTGEDMMAYAEARQAYEQQLADLDYSYATAVANTGYEKEQVTKGAVKGKSDANWDAAARGLFRSSIRDADLFDIDATAEMRKRFLDTQLDTLKLNTETQKAALDRMWNDPQTGYLHGLELKKIANAQGVAADMPQWKVEPGWEKPPAPAKVPQANKPKTKAPIRNTPISAKPNTGGTPYRPGSKPPPRPKAKTRVGGRRKPMGALYA